MVSASPCGSGTFGVKSIAYSWPVAEGVPCFRGPSSHWHCHAPRRAAKACHATATPGYSRVYVSAASLKRQARETNCDNLCLANRLIPPVAQRFRLAAVIRKMENGKRKIQEKSWRYYCASVSIFYSPFSIFRLPLACLFHRHVPRKSQKRLAKCLPGTA